MKKLERKIKTTGKEVSSRLTPWQKVQTCRHPQRHDVNDYIKLIVENFTELHGDRLFGDDRAIRCGFGQIAGHTVALIGQQKGRNVNERIACNFGMPHPEGYRKALRIMRLAEKFGKPVITFVDTPGAHPGVEAEERGQSEAIAKNIWAMSQIKVPIVSVVIGEGGSGGALAISVSDRIVMLENSVYSVISPEGGAAILWKDGAKSAEMAEALKMTADDLKAFGIIDEIIPEPPGGTHYDSPIVADLISKSICRHLETLTEKTVGTLLQERYERFRKIGAYTEGS